MIPNVAAWKSKPGFASLLLLGLLLPPALLTAQAPGPAAGWRPLFDGKSLAGWTESDFLGAGKVTVSGGVVTLGKGALTGIRWAGPSLPFPKSGYEIQVEAARLAGGDFFAGITFPVGDSYCTWINGGWGGEVVGLSSIDGADASMNDTTLNWKFETGRWYTFRLRVTPTAIAAWIDGESVIETSTTGKWISLREGEIEHSIPFGVAAYSTTAGIRKIEWRPLSPGESGR